MSPLRLTVYRPQELAAPLIEEWLSLAGEEYMAKLQARVDVGVYASKLHSRADSIVAWLNAEKAGYLALYATNANSGSAFISHVGVRKDLRGTGVATELMNMAESLTVQAELKFLELEVCCSNRAAFAFYEKCGFLWQKSNRRNLGTKQLL
jgi:ribosomal protein S18 acetylase RimI-like enzyme